MGAREGGGRDGWGMGEFEPPRERRHAAATKDIENLEVSFKPRSTLGRQRSLRRVDGGPGQQLPNDATISNNLARVRPRSR